MFKKCKECGTYLVNIGGFYIHQADVECDLSDEENILIAEEDVKFCNNVYGIPEWDYQKLMKLLDKPIIKWLIRRLIK